MIRKVCFNAPLLCFAAIVMVLFAQPVTAMAQEVTAPYIQNQTGSARDMSIAYIPAIPHPATSVFFVGVPHEAGPQIYSIVASSPITKVERTLFEDNRLAIDIHNSTTTLSGSLPVPPFLSVRDIRVSQFTADVTRVVFDLESGTEFSIDITPDRMTIIITIKQHVLQDFSFEAGEEHDTIILSGINPSVISVRPRPGQLRFYLSNTQLAVTVDAPLEGGFATHATLSYWGVHAALLELAVNEFTSHTIFQSGFNETTILLHPATYRNIRYNFDERTFRIPKIDGYAMHLTYAARFDMYHQRQFILSLPVNAMDLLGFGEMLIADTLLRSVTIAHSTHNTQLIFNGNQIFTLDLQEDEEHYIIKVMHPRERYRHIVIIDPGHGGRDPGAVRNGIRESDLNMLVTNKLLQLIEADGFMRAYTTRNSDVHVGLADRAHFGNGIGDIFVSIHHNAASGTHVHGIETYFRESTHDAFRLLTSRNLADIMHRHLLITLGSNDREVRSANFAVLRYSTIPAVLLELGFMSNAQEFARINTPEFQWQAAWAIYNALLEAYLWVPGR